MQIIDSHIHLYAQTHLTSLNWTADLPPDHILNRRSSVQEYKSATSVPSSSSNPNAEPTKVLGFVFVETDRKYALEESGWKDPLEEVAFLARIAQSRAIKGEGHTASDADLLLGMVPWAPLPAGRVALEKYVSKVRRGCGDDQTFQLVKGFRYLLQDKPSKTMLQPEFVDGLKWLGQQGFTFDLGVDARQGGIHQLREACVMLEKVFRDQTKLKVVINHFCKPNLRLVSEMISTVSSTTEEEEEVDISQHEEFVSWSECIRMMAGYPTTYMKLSGFFSELSAQDLSDPTNVERLAREVKPWVDVIFAEFGPSRILFGSDWPVCSAGGPGSYAWRHWVDLVSVVVEQQGLSGEEKQRVWSGTAIEAYNIDSTMIKYN